MFLHRYRCVDIIGRLRIACRLGPETEVNSVDSDDSSEDENQTNNNPDQRIHPIVPPGPGDIDA